MTLFSFNVTIELFYLVVILIILNEAFKKIVYMNNNYILFYLLVISLLLNFIFHGLSIGTFFESLVSVSFLTLIYKILDIFKKKHIIKYKHQNRAYIDKMLFF